MNTEPLFHALQALFTDPSPPAGGGFGGRYGNREANRQAFANRFAGSGSLFSREPDALGGCCG